MSQQDQAKLAKRGRGRPQIDPAPHLSLIRQASGMGLADHEIAALCGVSASTFCRWRKRQDVEAELAAGRATVKFSVARALYDSAVNDRNIAALIWIQKSWFGITDRPPEKPAAEQAPQENDSPQVIVYIPHNGRDDRDDLVQINKKGPPIAQQPALETQVVE